MKIEYIGHSGVVVELDNVNLLFDIIGFEGVSEESSNGFLHDVGRVPQLDPDKDTVIFASHNHGDHYSEKIWELRNYLNNVKYIISKDVHFSSGVRQRLGISDEYAKEVLRVKGHTSQDIQMPCGETIHVQTIPSTDEGVAFLVKADKKIIYHGGDHHMWMWEDRGEGYMTDMKREFTDAVTKLDLAAGEVIDVAFLLLDPRLQDHAYDGVDTYRECLPIKHIVPIHQWKNYDLTDAYIEDRNLGSTVMHKVTGENCEIII